MFWNQINNYRFKLDSCKEYYKHSYKLLIRIKGIFSKFFKKMLFFFVDIKNNLFFFKRINIFRNKKKSILYILIVLFFSWFFSGFFIINVNKKAVVTNFGKFSYVLPEGYYWRPRFITSIHIMDVKDINLLASFNKIITIDHNIIKMLIKIHYKIVSPLQYCFSSSQPKHIFRQIVHSKIYQLSGHIFLRNLLINNGISIDKIVRNKIQKEINKYHLGIKILDIDLIKISFPKKTYAYWKKLMLVKQYKEKCINNSEKYAERVLDIAYSHAKKILQSAESYKIRKILEIKSKKSHV